MMVPSRRGQTLRASAREKIGMRDSKATAEDIILLRTVQLNHHFSAGRNQKLFANLSAS